MSELIKYLASKYSRYINFPAGIGLEFETLTVKHLKTIPLTRGVIDTEPMNIEWQLTCVTGGERALYGKTWRCALTLLLFCNDKRMEVRPTV